MGPRFREDDNLSLAEKFPRTALRPRGDDILFLSLERHAVQLRPLFRTFGNSRCFFPGQPYASRGRPLGVLSRSSHIALE
jgi:hypothetical protein